MDTKKLRQKILDLAIRGKLVPQDPNDEPASVLLERIRAEKERLIAEGKIKRPRKSKTSASPSHYQQFEPPFEIPDSWEWVQVKDISSSILYGVSESAKSQGEYKLLRITDIQDNRVNWENVPYTDFDKNKAPQYILENGDIVFARTGATVGKSYLVESIPSKSIYASYLIRIRTYEEILPEYLKIFFESSFYWQQIFEGSVGIGQPNVNGTSLGLLWLPIPPRNEQRRIVSNTKDFTLIVSSMEHSKKAISESITQIRSKLLELAMQGKLVPQDPTDESAADLLKRVNPKAKIITDIPHYPKLPDNWVYIKLGDLVNLLSGRDLPNEDCNDIKEGIPYLIGASNINNGNLKFVRWTKNPQVISHNDDVLLSCKGTIGEIILNSFGEIHIARQFMAIRCQESILPNYLMKVLKAHLSYIRKRANGIIPGISRSVLLELVIPLPPRAEQTRIANMLHMLTAEFGSIAEYLN